MNTKETFLTAFHEAGHVVACLVSGGRVIEVSIRPCDGAMGFTRTVGGDRALFYLAGPWSEARYLWEIVPEMGTLDDQVDSALWRNPSDGGRRLIVGRNWKYVLGHLVAELEKYWPHITAVAEMLMNGCTDVTAITKAVNAELAADEAVS
jgi:Peptidase M50B-like